MFFTGDGKTVVAVGRRKVLLWSWSKQDDKRVFDHGGVGRIRSVALSADGKVLVLCGYDSKEAIVWDLEREKRVGVLRGHTDHVISVAVSADGATAATGGSEGTVKLWDLTGLRK